MIVLSLLGPLTSLYILGLPGLLVPATVGSVLAIYLTENVVVGETGVADIVASVWATVVVVAYFALLLYMTCWRKMEVLFSSTPWVRTSSNKNSKTAGRSSINALCPFTGLRPTNRCPSCQARVHDNAFYRKCRFLNFPSEAQVLRWDNAKTALQVESDDKSTVEQARIALDEALDYRGNQLFASMTECCIGCATWQKCFNLLPKFSFSLALAALFFAYVPWAFGSFLERVGQDAGAGLQVASGSLAVGLATAALLVQMHAFARSNAFLNKYQSKIPSMEPIMNVPATGAKSVVFKTLCGTPWDPAM